MNQNERERIEGRLELFRKADRGENPVCPKCGKGHIISMCNGRIYKCDNSDCDVYFSVLLSR